MNMFGKFALMNYTNGDNSNIHNSLVNDRLKIIWYVTQRKKMLNALIITCQKLQTLLH